MGQCVSRKAAGALAASHRSSAPLSPQHRRRNTTFSMHKSSGAANVVKGSDDTKGATKRITRGTAMSFGFRKRPTTAPAVIQQDNVKPMDTNGNGDGGSVESLATSDSPITSGRTTPRLAPPKKEAAGAVRTNRFGFRQNNIPKATNKVSDVQQLHVISHNIENKNNNIEKPRAKGGGTIERGKITVTTTPTPYPKPVTTTIVAADSNKNRTIPKTNIPHPHSAPATRFKLQSTQLSKPQVPVKLSDSKVTKTAVNNSRKVAAMGDEYSSKEGSFTEDSGVGSNTSGHVGNGETDTLHGIEILDSSPTHRRYNRRQRNLEMVVSGKNFNLREVEPSQHSTVITDNAVIALPRLPSVFQTNQTTGIVRERALEYQRQIERERLRNASMSTISSDSYGDERGKTSITSSEGYHEDFIGEEEKVFKDRTRNEKTMSTSSSQRYNSGNNSGKQSSPASSDEHDWGYAGEAMAEEYNYSFSSSDESREKEQSPIAAHGIMTSSITPALQNLMTASLRGALPKQPPRNVLLTIEDPKFAAMAAAASSGNLLDDETSPVDSLISSCTDSNSEELGIGKVKSKNNKMAESTSKDINEKSPSLTSPGTPTNASLSLSDGRDYFDDEIADQPGLVFDDTANDAGDVMSVTENTVVDSVSKHLERIIGTGTCPSESPRLPRAKLPLLNRAGSLDTLSPCESIASDDLMMDYDQSQSSGLDESTDRLDGRDNSALHSLNEDAIRSELAAKGGEVLREWSSLLTNYSQKSLPSTSTRTSRLLRSRATIPIGTPDSPRSLDSHHTNSSTRSRLPSSNTHSPLRLSSSRHHHHGSSPAGSHAYDSDDSVRVDRATHSSMMQDIVGLKTMLLKLKRVLQEPEEDSLMRSETLNPFDSPSPIKNGSFNGVANSDANTTDESDGVAADRFELVDLRRQVLFLQSQLEEQERMVQQLRNQLIASGDTASSSAPTSICETTAETCNAATQTERIRPVSAGPSLFQSFPAEGGKGGPLVSVTEPSKRLRPPSLSEYNPAVTLNGVSNNNHNANNNSTGNSGSKVPSIRLYRKSGASEQCSRLTVNSSIPKRSLSKGRAPLHHNDDIPSSFIGLSQTSK